MSVCLSMYVCGESRRMCVNTYQIFQSQRCGWLSLPWQPSSFQSRHWRTNTPPHKLCQWGYARLRGEVFVNRDIQVKNCLFTKHLFFPLQCKRHKPRSADRLHRADWLSAIQHQRWYPASRKSCMFDIKTEKQASAHKENLIWNSFLAYSYDLKNISVSQQSH